MDTVEEPLYESSTLLCTSQLTGMRGWPPVGAGLGQSVRKMPCVHVYLLGPGHLCDVLEATLSA